MTEIADLIRVMQEQMQRREERHQQQKERHQLRQSGGIFASQKQTPLVPAFESTAELWKDYLLRFKTFASANSVSDDKLALVFLTNQTSDTSDTS